MAVAYRYTAFISYAHEDEAFAASLHRRLERFVEGHLDSPQVFVIAHRSARQGHDGWRRDVGEFEPVEVAGKQ